MAIPEKVTKNLNLDLSDVPRDKRSAVKQEIGEFVVESILDELSQGKSPVKGEGSFKKLNKQYADAEKGGDRKPNLELFGDMLDSLKFKKRRNGVEVGIFKSSEVPKAYGHNSGFEGHPFLDKPELKRQFIPNDDEEFKAQIDRGIKDIIKENARVDQKPIQQERKKDQLREIRNLGIIGIDDLFDDIDII